MTIYSIALFLHIVGALGFFVVEGLEWIGLSHIRTTRLPEEARAIMGLVKKTNRLGFVSILMTVATGIYMMLTVWHGTPWILVVLGALVLEIVIFVVLSAPRMAAIEQALDTEERPLSKTFHTLVNHPMVWISAQTRIAILLGIVFLKIAKPDLIGSLLTIGIAVFLGLVSALPILRPERGQAGSVARKMIALFATAFVMAFMLLAARSISANTIPVKTNLDVQTVPAKRSEPPTEVPSSSLSTQTPTPSPLTALQEGSSLLQTNCTQCHSLQTVLQAKKTRPEWENALLRMKNLGTKISDSEKNVLLDYLTNVNQP